MALSKAALEQARKYNQEAEGKVWQLGDLPGWLQVLLVSSPEFALAVEAYQHKHGAEEDGKLGPLTLASMQATEGKRVPHLEPWGPVTLPGVELVPTARIEPKRTKPVVGVGIHTTGSGIVVAAQQRGIPVERVLRNLLGNPESYSSHCYVFPDGTTWLTVPTDECAQHGGYGATRALYAKGYKEWSRWHAPGGANLGKTAKPGQYEGWLAAAKELGVESPLELVSDPNGQLWAFDLIPVLVDGKEEYTEAQHRRAAELIAWAAGYFGFEPGPTTVLQHELWNPIARWRWDPGPAFSRGVVGGYLRAFRVSEKLRLGIGD